MKAPEELSDAVDLGFWRYMWKYNKGEFLIVLFVALVFCTGYWVDDQMNHPWIYLAVSAVWFFVAGPLRLWLLWNNNREAYQRWIDHYNDNY